MSDVKEVSLNFVSSDPNASFSAQIAALQAERDAAHARVAKLEADWESLLAVVDEAHSDTMRHTRYGGGTNPDEWRAEGAARALGEVLEAMAL